MDDGSLLRGEEERADAWRDIVVHRPETHASSDRSLPLWALLVAIAAHIAIFIALRSEIARRATVESTAISVQMIDLLPASPPAAEIPPEPVRAPIAHPMPRVMRERTPMSEPPIVAVPAAPPDTATPTLHLYNADGSLALPSNSAPRSDAIVARPLDAPPVADNTIMAHIRPLKVRPNHFDAEWEASHGGNPMDRFIADHLMKTTGVMRLPWGTRVQCAWIVIVAGCAWGPADYWHGDQSWKPATELDEK
jgi:hypothetical protein